MNYLITGVSGYVGTNLINYFSNYKKINCFALTTNKKFCLNNKNIEIILWDKKNKTKINNIFSKTDILIHLAAQQHDISLYKFDKYYEANVMFTELITTKAIEYKVKKIIFLSSIKVYGNTINKKIKLNDIPIPFDDYAKTKLLAEKKIINLTKNTNTNFVILRSPLIYGANEKGNLNSLKRIIKTGLPLPFNKIENSRSLLHILNLIDIISICIDNIKANNKIFLISDDYDISSTKIVKYLMKKNKKNNYLFKINKKFIVFIFNLFKFRLDIKKIYESLQIDVSTTKETLSWLPKYNIDNVFEKSNEDEYI